jgi:hypothetical protein
VHDEAQGVVRGFPNLLQHLLPILVNKLVHGVPCDRQTHSQSFQSKHGKDNK